MSVERISGGGSRRRIPPGEMRILDEDEPATPRQSLELLRTVPIEARAQTLAEYKQFLAEQREALAVLYSDIATLVMEHPEVSPDELEERVRNVLDRTHMDEARANGVFMALAAFEHRRKALRHWREACPDDRDLYKALFGKFPKGPVKVWETPVLLHIQCYDFDDYLQAFAVDEGTQPKDFGQKKRSHIARSGGINLDRVRMPELEGAIAVENMTSGDSAHQRRLRLLAYEIDRATGVPEELSEDSQTILLHEEQHAIHRLVMNHMLDPETLGRFEQTRNVPERLQLLTAAREIRERYADEHARTEIFAYLSEGNSRESIEVRLFETGGLYDYLTPKRCAAMEEELLSRKLSTDMLNVHLSMQDAIAEYPAVLHEALEAVGKLEKLYPFDQLSALFINEPLARWPKVATRLEEARIARGDMIKYDA